MADAQQIARRWWWGASALVVLLALALAGGGVRLALRQGRAIQEDRTRRLRDRAEFVSDRLQDELRRAADDRITRLHQAYQDEDDPVLNRIVSKDDWLELGFVYDHWALITWPATTGARSDRSYEALAPPSYGMAEQLEFVERNLEEAIERYRQCTGEATPVYWQLKAQMAIAGCRAKQKRFDDAIQIYERLRTRYAVVLRGLDPPSLFWVNLALIDVLTASGQQNEAARAAEDLLEQITAGYVPLPARECAEMLIYRLKQLTDRPPDDINLAERELADIASRQHKLASAADVVRTWMAPRLDPPLGTEEPGVQFVADTLGARPRALAYRRLPSTGGKVLVGVCIHRSALYETFVVPIVKAVGRGDLVVDPKSDTPSPPDVPWTQVLAMPLQTWQLQPAPAFLERVRHEVRRQTSIYIALTAIVVTVLMAAVAVLLLAVRREMTLTRLKNEFVANVSHELKTPLALIRLFGETLLYGRAVSDGKRREYYAVITRESERLTHLINNILDFSRIDAGHKRYERVDCDIGEVVSQTLEAYRFQLDHHGFECRVEIQPDLPTVSADADAVAQAVLNLLNNAVKYSNKDKVVEVQVRRAHRNGREGTTISVSDRGVGIPPGERDRLFDSFFRGSGETVRAIRGSGLGLKLVHHIVTGHEGDVWVDSTPGVGSTFTLFLPEANHHSSGES